MDLAGQTVLISGQMVAGQHVLRLYDQQDRGVAVEVSPGAGAKLEALAAERGAAKVLHLYDQRKDQA